MNELLSLAFVIQEIEKPTLIKYCCFKFVTTKNIFSLPLQDKKAYLDVIHTYMEVHGTVHGTSTMYIPGYVKNHGILSGRDLQFLLRETKVSLSSRSGGKKYLQVEGV